MPIGFQQTDEVTPSANEGAIWCAYESLSRCFATYTAVFLVSLFTTAISAFAFMPIETTGAVTPSETVDNTPAVGVSLSDIDFGGISTDSSGTVKTVSNTATINSSIYGYELYISSSDDTNSLVRSGTAGTSPSEIIPATSTTDITAPSVLSNDTWGFAVQRRNTTAGSGSEDVVANAAFDASYPTGDNSSANSKFAAIPTLGNKVLIAERDSTASNVPTNVYYGIRVTTDKPSGLYQGSVTYTAIGKAPTTHTVTIKTAPGISKVTIGETECTSSEGCDVTLTYGYSYSLSATTESGYTFNQWSLSNSIGAFTDGTSTSTTSNSATTTFIAGKGNTTITPSANPNTYSLSITFAGSGVDNVQIRTASGTGGELMGTVSTSGGSVAGLAYGTAYYLYPTFSGGYELDSWSKTSTAGALDVTTVSNPKFTMGIGDGAVTVTGKQSIWGYMQDFTTTDCQSLASSNSIAVKDRRDDNIYTVRYINGNCWMTSNLRFTDTFLDASTSNVTSNKTLMYYDLATDASTNDAHCNWDGNSGGNGFNNACIKDSESAITGVWYNFAAASAMTITGSFNDDATSQDICPKNWRLPTYFEQNDILSYRDDFAPITGGYYLQGNRNNIDSGDWWSVTAFSVSARYVLHYEDDSLSTHGYSFRVNGSYIRCIRDNTPSMQDFTKAMCQAQASSNNAIVRDIRDYNTYTVRYINGNCWMTQNLRLGGLSAIKLTVDDTDLASTDVYDSGQDGWYTPAVQTSGSDSWQSPVDAKHIHQQSDTNYGNLYNWYTATAGTGTSSMTNTDASSSICPKGWKLPPNTGTGSYTELMQATVDSSMAANGTNTTYTNAFQAAPLSFVLSGYYGSGLYDQGTRGLYWSRTAYSPSGYARVFDFYSSGYYYLQNFGDEYYGFAVRCVRVS